MSKMAIVCSACGADTFIRREPVYDGFKKAGERLFCVGCGHEYASEDAVPFKTAAKPQVFTAADRAKPVELFKGDEKGRNCRHCKHYVVNPFVQRCGLHQVEVAASDLCDDFSAKGDDDRSDQTDQTDQTDPLAKLLGKSRK